MSSRTVGSLRHRVRAAALQALFELDQTTHDLDSVVARISDDEMFSAEGRDFFARIVNGAWLNRQTIDDLITKVAPSWPVHQMPGVDIAVLRIALFEILYDAAADKAPVKAVINEAVELAKHFGSDNSGRFVNGVLSTVVNKPESEE
ncbi:transcription antitermination factor NusB [Herpetosiphon giganteus]|uniref:transcription antitermination factor NusB n=1 Tax=Herpetosiphon giganteus TaxID=2029754 RepID=UPI00195AEA4D|nr:transcription antitermination factor NusB [Herpetosiphon giganteus]